jgi:hypothetical protein
MCQDRDARQGGYERERILEDPCATPFGHDGPEVASAGDEVRGVKLFGDDDSVGALQPMPVGEHQSLSSEPFRRWKYDRGKAREGGIFESSIYARSTRL